MALTNALLHFYVLLMTMHGWWLVHTLLDELDGWTMCSYGVSKGASNGERKVDGSHL